MSRRRLLAAMLVALICLVLAQCTANPTPGPSAAPTSPPSTAIPSPTALLPTTIQRPTEAALSGMRVYYARPIFTPGEQAYNSSVEEMLEEAGFALPQWGSSLGKTQAQRIFDGCFAGIAPANALLAILTGTEVDDGTASEVGIFYALMQIDPTKKGIVGMHDDWRTNPEHRSFQGKGLNDFVLGCILRGGQVVRSAGAAVKRLELWQEELATEGLLGADPRAFDPPNEAKARLLGVDKDGTPTTKVYLAGPQYTPYAREYIQGLAQQMRELGMEVFVPTMRLATDEPRPTPEEVFDHDYAELESSNVLVALLDGTQIDDATALELGLFYGLALSDPSKKGIVGLITDVRGLRRRDSGFGCNHFPVGLIEYSGKICDNFDDVANQLRTWDQELRSGS